MKRLSNFLIVALAALFLAVGFAACGSNGGSGNNGGNGTGGGDKPSGGHTHTFIETVIEPTCTEKGYTIHKCMCGEKYEDSYVSALDHKLGEWNVTTPATEEKDGEEKRICTRENCDYFETRKIPKLDHTHDYKETVVEPTCTEKGYTLHKCECGEEYKDGETEALGHLFGAWETITPATEDSEGLEQRVCARKNCGFKEERAIPVLSHTHHYITTIVEPTCTERGYTKYTCEKCGNSYNANYKKALGHDYSTEWTVDEKATCQKTGIKSHHCTRCEAKTDETEIPLADHNYVDGVCTVCGNKTIEEATGLEYTLSADKTYYIVSDIGKETRTRFSIPTTYNGLPVKEIGEVAFYKKVDIIQVILADSIERIGGSAFNGCSNLQEIQIGNGLLTIGEKAFNECSSLDNLAIPKSVNEINKNAFSNCSQLIKYIKGVGYVDKWAIESDDLVTKVELKADTVGIADSAFSGCNSLASITIPDSITNVGDDAFAVCDSLKEVYITDIAAWCNIKFSNPLYCAHKLYLNNELVTDLIIPDSVTRIGNYAFYNCRSLTSITIPDSVTSIGDRAFIGCSSLTGVYITDIAAWCNIEFSNEFSNPLSCALNLYLNNELVTYLVIPDGVMSIGESAFYGCISLTSITIPDSVTSIGNYAFDNCNSLEKINVSENNAKYASVDGILYDKNKTEIMHIPKNIKGDVTIPDGVTSIGDWAFYGCSSLTGVTIGNGVISIGKHAFSSCSSLTGVTIGNGVISIDNYAFKGCSSLKDITYNGTKAEWRKITKGSDWKTNTGNFTVHCTDGDLTKDKA